MITQPLSQTATGETIVTGRVQDETAASENAAVLRSDLEAEISKLTWAVLDGKASLADRERLALLISKQHEVREARS